MSDPIPPPEDDAALQNAALAFINLFPSPTDDQVRAFAGLLGYEFSDFEAKMTALIAPLLDEEDDEQEHDIDMEADEANPLDAFLLSFYIIHPEPTADQLTILAALLGVTLEELETETYRVINDLEADSQDDTDVDTDTDLDSDFDGDDDETLTDGDAAIQLI